MMDAVQLSLLPRTTRGAHACQDPVGMFSYEFRCSDELELLPLTSNRVRRLVSTSLDTIGFSFSKLSDDEDPIFMSLGMVVLDEIRFPDGTVLCDIAGGSGLYSRCSSTPER